MKASRDGQVTSASVTRFDDTRAGTAYRDGSIDTGFEINTFDSSGFNVQTRLAAAETNELMGYMALDLGADPQVYSRSRTAKTTAGNDVEVGAGFQPIFLMGIGSATATGVNTNTAGGSMVVGITDGTDTISMTIHDEDGAATSNTHSRTTNTQFMSAYSNDGNIDWEATLSSFDVSGWTINYGNAAASSYQNAFLAIGTNPAAVTITGTVYVDEGVTDIGSGKKVTLSINGEVASQTVVTDATGTYKFTAPTSAGDVISIFIDDETENAVTVTVSNGGLLNNVHLFQNHLIVRHDNGGSLTNVNLATADDSGDSDVTSVYTMTGTQLDVPNGIELFIPSGSTYVPGAIINVDDIQINGVFTPDSTQTTTISGTFDTNGGVITVAGTMLFNASSGIININSNGQAINNVIFNDGGGSATWQFTGTFDVNGFFTLADGVLDFATNNAPLEVANNFTLSDGTFTPPVTTIVFNGDLTYVDNIVTNIGTLLIDPTTTLGSDMTCTSTTIAAGDTLITDGYEIDCSANMRVEGTLDATPGTDGNTTVSIGRNWDSDMGLLIMNNSTLLFDDTSGNNNVWTQSSNTFYNVIFDDGNGGSNVTWNLQGPMDIEGTLQIVEGTVDVTSSNYDIFVAGDWYNSDEFIARSATVVFDGTSDQTITTCDGCTDSDFNNIIVSNGSGSTVAFLDAFTVANFTATTADTNLNFEAGKTVTITGVLDLDGGAAGDEIFLNSSDFTNRFEFDVTGGAQSVSFVDVSNSEASSNDITATNSNDRMNTDSGDLPATAQWNFGGALKGAVIMVD